jgi:Flp pilus assembly protein TadG
LDAIELTMPKHRLFDAWRNDSGTSAVEYAIVAPVFIGLIVSSFYFCMGLYMIGSLHYAVEEGARCASVKTLVCSDSSSTIAYTQAHYYGPSADTPTFTYTANLACGNSVSASTNFVANLGLKTVTIPMTASACFP